MKQNEFHNGLRILRSVDRDELEASLNERLPDRKWEKFSDDPYRFFIGADDETADAIWRCIAARQPKV